MDVEETTHQLHRLEDKLDSVNDKLSAFPVVGQKLDDQARRLSLLEAEVHRLNVQVTENRVSNVKLMTMASGAAIVATIVLRWAMGYLDLGG